jgi:hypothetical protein
MLMPRQQLSNININGDKINAEKEYIDKTTYAQQVVDMDINFSDGTVKLTDELSSVAKVAVESRINSVKSYTESRIEKINNNLKLYYGDESVATDNKSLAKVFFPETFNAVEDWSDDLYLMFENMIDELEIEDIGDNIEQFLVKSLKITEVDDAKKIGFIRSMLNSILKGALEEKDVYYFKKFDIIKSFLKNALHKSKFKDNVEKFFVTGLNSGMFVIKDSWGPNGEYKLVKNKKNKMFYELKQEDVYKFKPIDSRLLIFPKHVDETTGTFPWIVEKIPTTFHELLNLVFDENGDPVENPKYDIKMLKKLSDYLKDVGSSTIKNKDLGEEDTNTDTEMKDLWDIDGDITLYEAHSMPLLISKGNGVIPFKCMITSVNLSENEGELDLFPIGVQKTPYISGVPYLHENFVVKDGDVAGIGLPELVKPLQTMLNNFSGHSVDTINMALWGIMVIDPDVFKDTTSLKNITPRLILQLKNMKGRRVEDVIQWLKPNLDSISAMGELFNLFQQAFKRTTRKGPTGEKVTPNPSATEFDSMINESQKSVNRVGLRINNMFSKMLERMYIYNMINMKERIKLKPQAYKINSPKGLDDIIQNKDDGDYSMLDKGIELAPEELFIDGLNFKLTAADTFNKRSVEKQQALQITNLLLSSGVVTDPSTGQPHVMVDETGAQVSISEYKLFKRLLDYFDYDNIFEKQQKKSVSPNPTGEEANRPPSSGAVSSPTLEASPETASIGQQATTLSQGINA